MGSTRGDAPGATPAPLPVDFHVDAWAAVGPGWKVLRVAGGEDASVDSRLKIARIPPPDSVVNRCIRVHEAVHAFCGPQQFGAGLLSVMLEEVRVNAIALRNGLEFQYYHDELALSEAGPGNRYMAAAFWLQTLMSACDLATVAGGAPRLRTTAPSRLVAFWTSAAQYLGPASCTALADAARRVVCEPTPAVREAVALELASAFGPPPPSTGDKGVHVCGMEDVLREELSSEATECRDRSEGAALEQSVDDPAGTMQKGGNSVRTTGMPWARFTELAMPHPARIEVDSQLAKRGTSRSLGRRMEPVDAGTEPSFWERWAADQRIFGRSTPGGTLAIDCSGSMRWDWEHLRRMLRRLPAATVVAYSGEMSARLGRVLVVAHAGRWSDPTLSRLGSNNLIDLEILEWLAHQPEPRIWLSDGEMNGGWAACLGARDAAEVGRKFARQGKIVRAETVETAICAMRRGGRPGVSSSGVLGWRDPGFFRLNRLADGPLGRSGGMSHNVIEF